MISGGIIPLTSIAASPCTLHPWPCMTTLRGSQCPHDVVKSGNRVPLAAQTEPQCLGGYRIISQQGSNPV